jgi:hypothetical protein
MSNSSEGAKVRVKMSERESRRSRCEASQLLRLAVRAKSLRLSVAQTICVGRWSALGNRSHQYHRRILCSGHAIKTWVSRHSAANPFLLKAHLSSGNPL